MRHVRLGIDRALKRLREEVSRDRSLIERFKREASLQASLNHKHIVKVIDFDQDETSFYFVMDFIDGPTLEQVRRSEGPLDVGDAITIAQQLADALHHAHTRNEAIYHRDIKPGNVLLASRLPPDARLTDFGIAKIAGGDEITQTGQMLATFRYAAPEQLGYRRSGEPVEIDGRADIYALAIVLYEMLEGKRFFALRIPSTTRAGSRQGSPAAIGPVARVTG